jgi:hypothetical protein
MPESQETQIEKKIADKIAETTAEWIQRHMKLGQYMAARGLKGLEEKADKDITVPQAVYLMDKGTEIERKAITLGKEDSPKVIMNIMNLWEGISEADL